MRAALHIGLKYLGFFVLLAGLQAHGLDRACSTLSLLTENRPLSYETFLTLYSKANPGGKTDAQVERKNQSYINLVDANLERNGKLLFLHMNLKPLKELNDKVFGEQGTGGKDGVNSVRNLFRILFEENVMADPIVSRALKGQFMDFKSYEMALDPGKMDPEIFSNHLNHVLIKTKIEFEKTMLHTLKGNPALQERFIEAGGIVSDFAAGLHPAGISYAHPDNAATAARVAASQFNSETGNSLKAKTFSEADMAVIVEETDKMRQALVSEHGDDSPLFSDYERLSEKVLSLTALDILRKSKAKNEAEYLAEKKHQFKARLGLILTHAQIKKIQKYYTQADMFQPSIRVAKRSSIDLSQAHHGFQSVDFAGQNMVNMYHTMGALSQAMRAVKPGSAAISLSRAGETKATKRLEALKVIYDDLRNQAGIRGTYQVTGDDGVVVPPKRPTLKQQIQLYSSMAAVKDAKPSDFRPVWVEPIMKSQGELNPGDMSTAGILAESVEKSLRAKLYEKAPLSELDKIVIPVHIDPNKKVIDVFTAGGNDATNRLISDILKSGEITPEGYHITKIVRLVPTPSQERQAHVSSSVTH